MAYTMTPELEKRIREIVREAVQEYLASVQKATGERWPVHVIQPTWPSWVETSLHQLTEAVHDLADAQQRSEERLTRLETTVQELADAQQRSEERLTRLEATVQKLADAQQRSEERLARLEATVQELADAQQRSEERLTRLEATVQELADAQQRSEERLTRLEVRIDEFSEQLTQMQKELRSDIERINNVLGLDAECEAQEVLLYVLGEKGYELLEMPTSLDIDGDVDVAACVTSPEGERYWVLVETKGRGRVKDLRRWSQRVRSEGFHEKLARFGVQPPYLCYFFGVRIYRPLVVEAQKLGIGVLDPDGERVPPVPIL